MERWRDGKNTKSTASYKRLTKHEWAILSMRRQESCVSEGDIATVTFCASSMLMSIIHATAEVHKNNDDRYIFFILHNCMYRIDRHWQTNRVVFLRR